MKYTKVIIKSEADLPKDSNWYIGFSEVINDFVHFNPIISNCKDLSWYLIEDTEKSYPEEFMKWCLENVSIDEKHGSEVYVLYTFGDRLMFPNMEKLHEYWLNEIKDK